MAKTAVVILNWNGKKYLEQFLPSVINHSGDAEIIIADNASTDYSIAFLQKHYPGLKIIKNKTNEGYAGGYNTALAQVDADYYVLLNSDIEVPPNWTEPIIQLMENDRLIAACQPKILDYNAPLRFEYAGAAGGYIDKYGYPFCRGRMFDTLEKDEGQYDDTREVFWATGACMFVRAETFHELGGFDPYFFAHMEEIDLCWRMKNKGYRVMYCGVSKIYHVGGGTLNKIAPFKTYLNIRNNWILLYKNLPKQSITPILFTRFLLDLLAAFKFLTDSGFRHFATVFKAHLHFFRNLKRHRKNRIENPKRQLSGIYKGNVVWAYYLKNKKQFAQLKASKFIK